jgi:hypothetical protein
MAELLWLLVWYVYKQNLITATNTTAIATAIATAEGKQNKESLSKYSCSSRKYMAH